MAPSIDIGQGGNGQRARMRRHVDAVGKKGHRAEESPATISATIMDRGQSDYGPCPPFVAPVVGAEEDMVVLPSFDRSGVHQGRSVTGIS